MKPYSKSSVLVTAVLVALVPSPASAQPASAQSASAQPNEKPQILFRDIAASAGVLFQHKSAPEKKYILESMSGGVALFDFNNDGLLDIYLVNSLTVDTAEQPKSSPSALYKNLGGLRFEDVGVAAGVAYPGWGMGICTADLDGDGWSDFYVTNVGANRLYMNNRDGTFRETAETAGIAAGGWSTGCGFADYDKDGVLDLFVSRYVLVDLENLPTFGQGKTCQFRSIAVQCGPRGLPGTSDLLFKGEVAADGQLRFKDVSEKAGVADADGYFGLGIAWFDYDDDGWLDLFVANDSNANFMYHNLQDGTFREEAFPLGVAVSEDGGEQGGMGVAIGDYENKGRLSLFVTNFAEEYNALFQNKGEYFSDASFRSASGPASLPYVGWGTALMDYDNDGWLDLMAVNGHVYPQLANAKLGASASYRQRRLLYRNRGPGKSGLVTFEEVAARFGEVLMENRVSRGMAVGDLDNDGRLDVVINDLDGQAQVLRNELAPAGHWLLIQLMGPGRNTSAVGAVVTLSAGGVTQKRVVRSGTSYLSQDDMRQHFGLGSASRAEVVRVLWPDGTMTEKKNIKANQLLVIDGSHGDKEAPRDPRRTP